MSSASYASSHILLDLALIPVSDIDHVTTNGKIMLIHKGNLTTMITYSSEEEVELNLLRIHAFIRLHEADKVLDKMMRDDDKISYIKDVILTKQQIQSSLNVLNDHGSDNVLDYKQIQRLIYNATGAIHHLQTKYIDDLTPTPKVEEEEPPSNLTTFVEGVGILALDEIQTVYISLQDLLRITFLEGTESHRAHSGYIAIQYSDAEAAQHALIRLNNAMDEDQEEEEEHDQIEEDLKQILNLLNDLTKEQQQEVYSHIYEDINKQRQEKQLEPLICTEYKKQKEEDKGSKTTTDDLEKILAACKASATVQNATKEDINKALALIKAATIRVGAFHGLKKQDQYSKTTITHDLEKIFKRVDQQQEVYEFIEHDKQQEEEDKEVLAAIKVVDSMKKQDQDSKTTHDLENILAEMKAAVTINNATTDDLKQLLTKLDDLTEEEQQSMISRIYANVKEQKERQDGFMSNLESISAEQKTREEKDWTPKAMRAREDALIDGKWARLDDDKKE